MDDNSIVELYWKRSESAITETANKYNGYCYSIAYNILANKEDSEESVSDAWLTAWNVIPPRRPTFLAAFLGKITRHISIDRWRVRTAQKRGGGEVAVALDELGECVSGGIMPEEAYEQKELVLSFNRFLDGLTETERSVFLCRYWYLDTVPAIAVSFGFSRSKVTSMLHRTRAKLRVHLEKEGLA